jgi:TonB family protein
VVLEARLLRFFPLVFTGLLAGSIAVQQPGQPIVSNPENVQALVEKINPPVPRIQIEAEFPEKARIKKLNGKCVVSLGIDLNGVPQNVHIARCTDPVFEKSSLEAAAKYRFKPATNSEGKQVPAQVQIMIAFELMGVHDPVIRIHYSRYTPPGVTSFEPGPDRVYPYSKNVDPPVLTAFSDDGYGDAAFATDGTGACDITLTIDQQGKPSNPEGAHCTKIGITRLAAESLLDSRYTPGKVNGKPVAVRMAIHLEFVGFFPKQ